MIRALSASCAALLGTVLMVSPAQAAPKSAIAVLGLEVVDPSGTPTPADTAEAENLTKALRTRAQVGTGTYQYVPRSEKELVDEKVLNNCATEKVDCMSAIGKQLGADMLMYGRIEREKGGSGYVVTVTLLDVNAGRKSEPYKDHVSQSADLDLEAKKIYSRLTGDTGAGTLDVRLSGADRGTIYVDNEPKGTISSGEGEVSGLSEGKHHVAVEVGGFRRWERDVTITAGETSKLDVDNLQRTETTGTGNGNDTTTGTSGLGISTGTPEHPGNSWKGKAIGGAVVTGVLAIGYGVTWLELSKTGGTFPSYGGDCHKLSDGGYTSDSPSQCANGGLYTAATYVTGIAAILGAGFTGYAIYRSVHSHSDAKDAALRGHRVPRDRFVITPVIAPNGGGMTFRMDW